MTLLLRGGRVVDPASGLDGPRDVLIEDGRVTRIESRIDTHAGEVVDVGGLVVCPGFLDMHVHLREPGEEWKETVATGTRAAARGGFTGIACMPDTVPVNDSRSVTELIVTEGRERGRVPVYPVGCITKGQKGVELAEMEDMIDAGAVAFSDDERPLVSSMMMRKALEYSRVFDVPVIDHCEDPQLVDGGVMHEGEYSTRLGLRGSPTVAEDLVVQRDILLAEYSGGHVHIAHISSARSIDFVREAKARGVRVTCEVTPHHLTLTEAAIGDYDTNAKTSPPLRAQADVDAAVQGLVDGTIDAIATDHAPHHVDEKCVEFSLAPFGVVGLETAVPLTLDRLVRRGVIDLNRLVALFTTGPAGILHLNKGRLAPGTDADITVLNLDRETTVDPQRFESKGANTPFGGWTLRGSAVMTIVGGRVVHDERISPADRARG